MSAIAKFLPKGKLAGKNILVTGANGFLGRAIIEALSASSKASITALSLHKPAPFTDRSIKTLTKDLSRDFTIGKYDHVFHAAGYGQPAKFMKDPDGTVAVNVSAVRALLDSTKNFVYFSSAEVYGDIPNKEIPVKETYNGNSSSIQPRSIYGQSKRLGEALCAEWARARGVNAKIVRISHVYGPGLPKNDARVMSDFIRKGLFDKKIALLDEGRAVKTYGYIDDVTTMIVWAAFIGNDLVYNVGGRDSLSIAQLARSIGRLCGAPVSIPKRRSALAHIGRDPHIVKLDLSKVLKGMRDFRFTPFSEGLARTVAWSREKWS